jgi:hypothetical protein
MAGTCDICFDQLWRSSVRRIPWSIWTSLDLPIGHDFSDATVAKFSVAQLVVSARHKKNSGPAGADDGRLWSLVPAPKT